MPDFHDLISRRQGKPNRKHRGHWLDPGVAAPHLTFTLRQLEQAVIFVLAIEGGWSLTELLDWAVSVLGRFRGPAS